MFTFTLTLLRHGETNENKKNIIQGQLDTPLSAVGIEQCQLVAEKLQRETFTHVFSSDLSRAYQTGEYVLKVNEASKCAISQDVRLRERKLGDLEGKTMNDLRAAASRARVRPSEYNPNGGETAKQVRQRAEHFFKDICQQMSHEYKTLRASEDSSNERHCSHSEPQKDPSDSTGETVNSASEFFNSGQDINGFPLDGDDNPPVQTATLCDFDIAAYFNNQNPETPPGTRVETSRRTAGRHRNDELQGLSPAANVLVVTHGGLIRELVRHFVDELSCHMPCNKQHTLSCSPNTGISKFLVSVPRDQQNQVKLVCLFMHDKEHLVDNDIGE